MPTALDDLINTVSQWHMEYSTPKDEPDLVVPIVKGITGKDPLDDYLDALAQKAENWVEKLFWVKDFNYENKEKEERNSLMPSSIMKNHVSTWQALGVKNIIFNPPATIVFWTNGDKTVVKCQEGQEYNPYFGFCAAVAKRIYGSTTTVNNFVDKKVEESGLKKIEKKPVNPEADLTIETNHFFEARRYENPANRACTRCA